MKTIDFKNRILRDLNDITRALDVEQQNHSRIIKTAQKVEIPEELMIVTEQLEDSETEIRRLSYLKHICEIAIDELEMI